MAEKFRTSVVDPSLKDWIIPDFTTTTDCDRAVASIMFMSAMQAYFDFSWRTGCGLPSVTLLGEKSDWQSVFSRLDKFESYDIEPARFADLLRPVMGHFILSFDEPHSDEVGQFWRRDCTYHGGSGTTYFSGWITAFCFWDDKVRRIQSLKEPDSKERASPVLDEVRYDVIGSKSIPAVVVKVPARLEDHGEQVEAEMTAGVVGIECSSPDVSGDEVDERKRAFDSTQPTSGRWIVEKLEDQKA